MTSQSHAVPYDLVRPAPLVPREVAALRRAAIALADVLGPLLSEYLGCRFEIALRSAGTGPAGDAHPLPPRSVWIVPSGMDTVDAPIWRLDWPLASALVELMTGIRRASHRAPDRAPSRLEGLLLCCLCGEAHAAWERMWPVRTSLPGPWRCITETPQMAGPSPDDWARLALDMSNSRLSGGLDVYLPVRLAKLPEAQDDRRPRAPLSCDNAGVCETSVTAAVRLATWRAPLRDLLALEEGQIIDLDVPRDTPLALCIGGLEKLAVRAGTHDGRVSVQVVDGT